MLIPQTVQEMAKHPIEIKARQVILEKSWIIVELLLPFERGASIMLSVF